MASDVLLDLNWRRWDAVENTMVVGWPLLAAHDDLWASQKVEAAVPEYAAAGFGGLRFWPSCECGGGRLSDGYDKKNDYSINNTAFGDGEHLIAAVKAAHDHGLTAWGDLVLHQYGGFPGGNYTTPRFPKHPSCFVKSDTIPGGVDVDPVPDSEGNFGFGDMCSYLHSTPGGYMYFGAIEAARWLTETVNFDGFRIDDVKGTYAPVVEAILDAIKKPGIGEYFDGNDVMVSRYVNQIMKRKISVLDFAFKFNVGDICNNAGRSWMGKLADIGWCTKDWSTADTWVDSADTDTSIGEQTIWNKILGYAIMMAFPGRPSVFYRDWSDDPYCYNLKKPINNLMWIRKHLMQGEFVPRVTDQYQTFACERMGFGNVPGGVAAFNNDPDSGHTIWVPQRQPPGTRMHEYAGLCGYNSDRWVDNKGGITIDLPRNDNGKSYAMYGVWVG